MHSKEEERQMLKLYFDDTPKKLKGEYLDMYEGIHSDILSTTTFTENSNLSLTYLERLDIARASKIKAEGRFPISEQEFTLGKLLDGT